MVLLRFAPSPTGALHLGGLRTALLNYLVTKKLSGKWILRIEDTDTTRLVPGSVDNIRESLEWAGLHYDYGPGLGGPHGPYFQSQRLDLYKSFSDKLLESRHAYRCFCTPDTLNEIKSRFKSLGSSATYDRTCLHLTDEEVSRRVKSGQKHVIRLHDSSVPSRPIPSDLVFGILRNASLSLPTDPILLKSDLYPTYHFASVVDDSQMGITHVLRGEEWLPSLPLHLNIYAALALQPPQFAHLPLLLNPDGSKMSKRNGDVRVTDYINAGWEPEAVINWLALAGWGNRTGDAMGGKAQVGKSIPDVFTLNELLKKFDISAITSRRGSLDPGILRHLNKEHIKIKVSTPEKAVQLARKVIPTLIEAFPQQRGEIELDTEYVTRVVSVMSDRTSNILDLASLAPYFFVDPDWETDAAGTMRKSVGGDVYQSSLSACIKHLAHLKSEPKSEWNHGILADTLQRVRHELGCASKEIMTPLRHAVTGMKDGPSVVHILEILGKESTLRRLRNCLEREQDRMQ